MNLTRYSTSWALLAFFLLAPQAGAQSRPSRLLPTLSTTTGKVLKPGTWVRYSLYSRRTKKTVKVRMAALKYEGKAQWFEISLTDPRRRTIVIRSLVLGTLAAPKKILQAVVQPPGQRALLLPESMARDQMPSFTAGPGPQARYVATEQIKVAAGTFKAKKYRRMYKGKETWAWFSSSVKGWPMVKVVNQRLIMELVDHGTNARTQVRGKPVKMSKEILKQMGL